MTNILGPALAAIRENDLDCFLSYLGRVYTGGGEFTETIDCAGGEGTGAFACEAIRIYCDKRDSFGQNYFSLVPS